MASAKFLEEALSTAVDESAVNAIVGTLETQLVNSTPSSGSQTGTTAPVQQNHVGVSAAVSNGARQAGAGAVKLGVAANGGTAPASFVLNSSSGAEEASKSVSTATASVGTATSTAPFVNLVAASVVAPATASAVKLVYPSPVVVSSTQTQVSTANAVNSRFVAQPVSLPNGTVGPPAPAASPVVVSSSETVTNSTFGQTPVAAANKVNAQSGMDQAKPTGTALVIKSGVNSSSQCTGTMTLTGSTNTIAVSTVPGMVTLQTKPMNQTPQTVAAAGQATAVHAPQATATSAAIVGGSPQIVPANLQILNVNALRGAAPVQAGKAGMAPRVMIGAPQIIGGRPAGQITLQTLQGLAPGAQGHLILKTENGQYQLLRVGPAPSPAAGQPTTATAALAGSTFRVQTINVTNANAVQTPVATQGTATVAPAAVIPARGSVDQTKEKCRKFLANLLELSSREPKAVERNVRTLIQELVDTKVEPEQFCDRLEKLLNASPQPCLIGFLKKSLPLLRQSMVNNELVIDGIRPPPASVLFTTTTTTTTTTAATVVAQPQLAQVSGLKVVTQNMASNIRPPVQMASAGTQVRVATPSAVRPGQPIQHRVITPMRLPTVTPVSTVSASVATAPVTAVVNKSVMPTTPIRATTGHVVRPTTQIIRTPSTIPVRPGLTTPKATQFTTRPVLATTTQFNQITTPAKPTVFPVKTMPVKEREKKTFSSSSAGGFMGDDDINDVAAMGGVNLAEESQRILGSTEFVGTQIRSCKDDIFLHANPLMNKIAQIASKFGLQEPNSDVASLMSHATQERLKDLVEKLAVLAEHRVDLNKTDPRYEITQDVRAQLKCLEEIDKAERKRHEEQERELLLRAAKSRTKPEDPEQAKLKAKAKEMQRAEMEELRQREANMTALLAIGPRKKPKLDDNTSGVVSILGASQSSTPPMQLRPRVKRVCLRDMLMVMEQERELCRTPLLYKSYLK